MQGECSSPEAAFPEGIHKGNWHDVSDVKHSCFSKGEVTCDVALVTSSPAVTRPTLVTSVTDMQAGECGLNTVTLSSLPVSADGCSQFGL